jgi:general nucleoside transport system ATP-binding protein
MSAQTALSLRAVQKRFGGTVALADASCDVRTGTVHALLGENGAGKTTLMRIAFGLVAPDQGTILRDGRAVRFTSGRDAIAAGLGMVHQHFMLVPAFTVAENAALGGTGRFDPTHAAKRVREVAQRTGLAIDPNARVADLPIGAQQRAELVRALAQHAQVLILDEPTAVLTPAESEELYRWMRRFADDGGTVVLITHKLREALAVADDVTVLRQGRTVLAAPRDAITEDALVAAIMGHDAPREGTPIARADANAEVVFALDDVSWTDAAGVARLKHASLTVRRGEILGVLGVEGSGQAELLRLLAGRLAPTSGRVTHPSRVGFVPGDRLHDAVIPMMSATENLVLAEAGHVRGTIDWRAREAETARVISAYEVRAAGPTAPLASLSGGNQQKFVVGRERGVAPQAIVAENPTRGLDVRAAARVLAALRAVAEEEHGAAVVCSTDLDEVLALTSRIVVCFAGTVTEVAPPADANDRSVYARALLGATA